MRAADGVRCDPRGRVSAGACPVCRWRRGTTRAQRCAVPCGATPGAPRLPGRPRGAAPPPARPGASRTGLPRWPAGPACRRHRCRPAVRARADLAGGRRRTGSAGWASAGWRSCGHRRTTPGRRRGRATAARWPEHRMTAPELRRTPGALRLPARRGGSVARTAPGRWGVRPGQAPRGSRCAACTAEARPARTGCARETARSDAAETEPDGAPGRPTARESAKPRLRTSADPGARRSADQEAQETQETQEIQATAESEARTSAGDEARTSAAQDAQATAPPGAWTSAGQKARATVNPRTRATPGQEVGVCAKPSRLPRPIRQRGPAGQVTPRRATARGGAPRSRTDPRPGSCVRRRSGWCRAAGPLWSAAEGRRRRPAVLPRTCGRRAGTGGVRSGPCPHRRERPCRGATARTRRPMDSPRPSGSCRAVGRGESCRTTGAGSETATDSRSTGPEVPRRAPDRCAALRRGRAC